VIEDDWELASLKLQYDLTVMVWNSYANLILFARTDEDMENALKESDEALARMNEIEAKIMEKIRNG